MTTGHIRDVQSETSGLQVKQRIVQEYIELRTPFTVTRQAIDDVARGSGDSDWQPVKDAATTIAMAEDRAILHGLDAAGIGGIVPGSSNAAVAIPDAVEDFADAVAQALSVLRTVGVDGPYSLLLSSAEYTKVSELPTTATRSASTSPGSSAPERSSGRPRLKGRCSPPRAGVTTSSTSARTCRSVTTATTARPSNSICRRPSDSSR